MTELNKLQTIVMDASQLTTVTYTDDGFLKADCVITAAGVYQNDGAQTYLPAEEIFNDAAIKSMEMLPVTNDHPATATRLLDATTTKKYQVGNIGNDVRRDGDVLRASIIITDNDTINAINNGKRQLSIGYKAMLYDEDGMYNGKPYSRVIRDIIGNHVAVVNRGRVGAIASIMSAEKEETKQQQKNEESQMTLKTIMLDSIEYQAAPEVANAYAKQSTEIEKLQKNIAEQKICLDERDAKIEALQKSLDDVNARDINAEIKEAADKRIAFLYSVQSVFGDEAHEKVAKLSDREGKVEVLKPLYSNITFSEQSDEYINALYDATCQHRRDSKVASQRSRVSAATSAQQSINNTVSFSDRFNK